MIEIKRGRGKKVKVYEVFEPGDALPNRDILEVGYNAEKGDLVISDDGYVAEVIKVYGPYDRGWMQEKMLILPYCRKWVRSTRRAKLMAKPYLDSGRYTAASEKAASEGWQVQETRTERTKRVVSAYARLMVESGGRLTDEQMATLGKIYRPDQENPKATFKKLLKQDIVKSMVKDELVRILSENGLTPDAVIKTHLRIVSDALDSGQLSVAEKANSKFMEMLDMKPDKTSTQIEATVSWDHLLGDADEAEYELKPKQSERLKEHTRNEEQED